MKLKTVTVEFDMVIAVSEEGNAEKTARDHIIDAMHDMCSDDFELSITDYKNGNANGWDGDCIPYGGDGNTRISEIV